MSTSTKDHKETPSPTEALNDNAQGKAQPCIVTASADKRKSDQTSLQRVFKKTKSSTHSNHPELSGRTGATPPPGGGTSHVNHLDVDILALKSILSDVECNITQIYQKIEDVGKAATTGCSGFDIAFPTSQELGTIKSRVEEMAAKVDYWKEGVIPKYLRTMEMKLMGDVQERKDWVSQKSFYLSSLDVLNRDECIDTPFNARNAGR